LPLWKNPVLATISQFLPVLHWHLGSCWRWQPGQEGCCCSRGRFQFSPVFTSLQGAGRTGPCTGQVPSETPQPLRVFCAMCVSVCVCVCVCTYVHTYVHTYSGKKLGLLLESLVHQIFSCFLWSTHCMLYSAGCVPCIASL
jgi:hypothetical protein